MPLSVEPFSQLCSELGSWADSGTKDLEKSLDIGFSTTTFFNWTFYTTAQLPNLVPLTAFLWTLNVVFSWVSCTGLDN